MAPYRRHHLDDVGPQFIRHLLEIVHTQALEISGRID